MIKKTLLLSMLAIFMFACDNKNEPADQVSSIKVSENNRFFVESDGSPFFWLGDTGWLLFKRLDREEVLKYLNDRSEKGFNVIQASVIHTVGDPINAYGDSAIVNLNVAKPRITEGDDPEDPEQYDYWDHVDFVVEEASKRGIHMGMVLMWGSNVDGGYVSKKEAVKYAEFLAERYKDDENIIWLNGGDTKGSESTEVWNAVGHTLQEKDPNHLVTFHPDRKSVV